MLNDKDFIILQNNRKIKAFDISHMAFPIFSLEMYLLLKYYLNCISLQTVLS